MNRERFMPLKSFAITIMRIMGLVAYTLIFSELFIRFFAPQPIMPRYVTAAPWGVRGNIPDSRYWQSSPEVHVEIRINHWGMRDDRNFSFEKPGGFCRIAVFGDSFLMGYELDLKDTFGAGLEAKLKADGFAVEVMNFSVSGFGTAEMLLTYKKFARRFDPDIVLLGWNGSDFDDNLRSGLYRLTDDGLVRDQPTFVPTMELQRQLMKFWAYRWAQDNSHLYSLVRERAGALAKRVVLAFSLSRLRSQTSANAAVGGKADDEIDAAVTKSSVALSAALLLYAKRLVDAEGRELIIVDVPARISRTKFVSSFEDQLGWLRGKLNVVLPAEAFRAKGRPDVKLFWEQGSGHLTQTGVQILVDLVEKAVMASPKLSSCRVSPGRGSP